MMIRKSVLLDLEPRLAQQIEKSLRVTDGGHRVYPLIAEALESAPLARIIDSASRGGEKSQLEQQIVDHHWLVVPAVPEIVFEKEDSMWKRAIEFYGDSVLSEFPGVGKHPQRAAYN